MRTIFIYELSYLRVVSRLSYMSARDTEHLILTDKQNIKKKILTMYCFVFFLKMQPWGLFQVTEATNVFFMILRECFISENVINLSLQ